MDKNHPHGCNTGYYLFCAWRWARAISPWLIGIQSLNNRQMLHTHKTKQIQACLWTAVGNSTQYLFLFFCWGGLEWGRWVSEVVVEVLKAPSTWDTKAAKMKSSHYLWMEEVWCCCKTGNNRQKHHWWSVPVQELVTAYFLSVQVGQQLQISAWVQHACCGDKLTAATTTKILCHYKTASHFLQLHNL